MQLSDVPSKIQLPFANSGSKNVIPVPSQIGITDGAASYTDGFPPLTDQPESSGGIPPAYGDLQGILNIITANTRWNNVGSFYPYDAVFSAAVGGYPKGSVLARVDGTGFWLSTIDNNTNNPESVTTGWVPINNSGATTLSGLTNANVTMTPMQYAKRLLILTGTLTGNIQIIFPALPGDWIVIDLTTPGAFTTTLKTASGTGVSSAATGAPQYIVGDGTNILSPFNNATLTGVPKAPTATFGTNTNQIASTAFVEAAVNALIVAGYLDAPGLDNPACSYFEFGQIPNAKIPGTFFSAKVVVGFWAPPTPSSGVKTVNLPFTIGAVLYKSAFAASNTGTITMQNASGDTGTSLTFAANGPASGGGDWDFYFIAVTTT